MRVVAPLATRLAWLQEEHGLTEAAARAYMDTSSRLRARYMRRSYGVDVNDPALYHLVINTGLFESGSSGRAGYPRVPGRGVI